ncbi:MAG: FimV/HubP family polar landmark protein [Pseudomonas sp.]|uniref:FimV/HubP family polar landmark protein n=1 Tax=Pseudomonas sp. TaxID=306 RepID=UPI002733F8E9|nr:FimV/HubP family polar landmark protein [Pseudomonas sp.]MDP3844861.1 FimV/HubP family polar landmark protein [Pseudomonas sp.]
MVQVRKLVLAIAAASALSSGMAQALGLGEVSLKSSLDQPLVAEIELLEVRDLATGELIPSLASPEDFTRAGVDRQFLLNDLKFTPVIKANGKSFIRVTSSKPIREPYLNFLVEVLWPSGRLLREYTVLLDPPLYSPQTTAAAAPRMPVAAPMPRPVTPAVRPVTAAAPAPVAAASRPAAAPVAATSNKLSGKDYKTTSSDTLWEIARRLPGGSANAHQTMLAIQDLNPDAFIGGNINRLKSGQVLRLPDQQQINSRSPSEAIAQVNEQTAAWREGRSIASSENRQLDATKRNVAGAAPAKTEAKDSLQLVAAETGKAGAGSDKGANGDSKALNDQLQVTKESLDSTRRENGELKGRMTDLQSQLDKLQRLIQLKDDQLAKLQADLAAKGKTAAQPTAVVVAPAPATKEPAVAAPAVKEPVAAPVPVPTPAPVPVPAVDAGKPAATPAPATDFNYSEEPAKPAETVAPAPVEAAKPVVEVAPVKPVAVAPAMAPVAEPEAESFIDGLLANPMLLAIAGGGGLLALLIGLMMLSKRNAQKEAELLEGLHADDDEPLDSDLELPESSFDELDTPVDTDADLDAAPERVTAQTADPLGEADIYIAYGRFNQAAELLQNAINDEPQRSDLRLKLLEVQAELGDRDGFARQESELREIGGVTADVDQIKAKYPGMTAAAVAVGVAAAASNMDAELDAFSLDDLDLDEPAAAAPGQDMDDAFDLSLDDLEAELDSDLAASNAQGSSADFADLSLDGDFDLADEAVKPTANQELSFDLELDSPVSTAEEEFDLADFSLEMEADGQPSVAGADEDFLLSLDDEPAAVTNDFSALSLDLPADEPADALDLPADFDLSLAEEAPAVVSTDSFAAHLDEVTAELEQLANNLDQPDAMDDLDAPLLDLESAEGLDGDDDFDFLSGTDESATKLDLARAYIDMGDTEGARDILDEVVAEGSDTQQQEARDLIARLT